MPDQTATAATCRHCGRRIVSTDGCWVDPEATGDDSVWRETCDAHDTFTAEHEPADYESDVKLALWFTPQAIRDHYEGDDDDPTRDLSDKELAAIGEQALTDDGLYRAFHSALEWALGREE